MKKQLCFVAVLTLMLCSVLVSCADYALSNDTHGIGQTVTPEIIESVKSGTSEAESIKPAETLKLDENTLFYWTRNGSKLHFYSDCRYLSKTDPENMFSGTYFYAYNSVKLDEICSACFEKSGIEVFDPSELMPDSTESIDETDTQTCESTSCEIKEIPSVLYWTLSGSKYHLYRNCRSLSGSDDSNVRSGDIFAALESGKQDACSFCLKECGISAEELPWSTQSEETD